MLQIFIMAHASPFTVSAKEASKIVSNNASRVALNENLNDSGMGIGGLVDSMSDGAPLRCYMMQLTFTPVYGETSVPQMVYKKLPRLVNGIPLGAGKMTQGQAQDIMWRYVEGSSSVHTFMSLPMTQDEAEESRRRLKDRLVTMAKAVFGEVSVKASIVLSQCLHYEHGLFLNDIAQNFEEGLHFSD